MVSNHDDVIDLRDVIAEIERLEKLEDRDESEDEELKRLMAFMDECKGNGGDEQWRGDWYPILAISDIYFSQYTRELADDLGLLGKKVEWPHTCIDWEKAATELQGDYTLVDFDGTDYWVR